MTKHTYVLNDLQGSWWALFWKHSKTGLRQLVPKLVGSIWNDEAEVAFLLHVKHLVGTIWKTYQNLGLDNLSPGWLGCIWNDKAKVGFGWLAKMLMSTI